MKLGGHIWQPEDDALLLERWAAGDSAAAIADLFWQNKIELTRNAILGRLHRLRSKRAKVIAKGGGAQPPVKKPAPRAKAQPSPPPRPARLPEPLAQLPEPPRITVRNRDGYKPLRLRDPWPMDACRWPVFTGRIDERSPIFCGEPVAETGCYCTEHAMRARPRPQPTTSKAGAASSPRARTHF
jgi:hypothetical protein